MALEDGFDMASTPTNRDKWDGNIPLKRLSSDDDIKVWSVVSTLDYTVASTHKRASDLILLLCTPPLHWGILLLPTKAGAASAQPCMHTDNDQVN